MKCTDCKHCWGDICVRKAGVSIKVFGPNRDWNCKYFEERECNPIEDVGSLKDTLKR